MTETKTCNILCSGPRRKSYEPNGYDNIAVNFPWTTDIKYMVFSDVTIPPKLMEIPDLVEPNTKLVIGTSVREFLGGQGLWERFRELFHIHSIYEFSEKTQKLGTYKRSSGHYACEFAISQGYKKLNIFGCDNWFGDRLCIDNWSHKKGTRHYLQNDLYEFKWQMLTHELNVRADFWNKHWHELIKKYPAVEFNFVP